MKTNNKFDENIRKKLEGINPEFREQDWKSMQRYMRLQSMPSFLQTYGHWLGYGVAAATLTLTGVLYYLQFEQNSALKEELNELKSMLTQEAAKQPQVVRQTDTVYIALPQGSSFGNREFPRAAYLPQQSRSYLPVLEGEAYSDGNAPEEPAISTEVSESAPVSVTGNDSREKEEVSLAEDPAPVSAQADFPEAPHKVEWPVLEEISRPSGLSSRSWALDDVAERHMKGRYVKTSVPAVAAPVVQPVRPKETKAVSQEVTKAEKAQEAQRLLPDFITKRAYRVGVGFVREPKMTGTAVLNEIILSPSFSVTWGIAHQKYEAKKFFNEIMFRDKTRESFRHNFGKGIPQNCEVMNIVTYSTLFQLPLQFQYRHGLGHGFSLLGGAGTYANLRFRQHLSYDLRFAFSVKEESGLQFRKKEYPVFNNFNISTGVEKNFDPFILQGELYYQFQENNIPYLQLGNGFGFRLKAMLQFGRKI